MSAGPLDGSSLAGNYTGEDDQMKSIINRVQNFLRSEDGPTATEYAVMLALIIVVAIAAITTLGQSVNSTFTNVNGSAFGS